MPNIRPIPILVFAASTLLASCASLNEFKSTKATVKKNEQDIRQIDYKTENARTESRKLDDDRLRLERDLERTSTAMTAARSKLETATRAAAPGGPEAQRLAQLKARLQKAEQDEQAARRTYQRSAQGGADKARLSATLQTLEKRIRDIEEVL